VTELEEALGVAVAAAQAAAVCQQRRPEAVRHKGAIDLVTEVDLASEAAIREVLGRATPGIPVLGEEGGGAETATTRWVVDPLDGTTNFVHGLPHFGPSIALEIDGVPQVGVVIDVSRGEVFRAARGHGATCNDQPLRVSGVTHLGQALVATGFAYDRQTRAAFYLTKVQRALEQCQGVRRAGAAALDFCWVAAGRLDAYWEYALGRWDVAAGWVLVEEAGGRVDWMDDTGIVPAPTAKPAPIVSNGHLHDAFVELITA